jgi:dihydroxyacetone kinase-like protein
MPDTIGYDEVVAMCRAAAEVIHANKAMLGELDSHGGDGDHGATISKAFGLLEKAIDDDQTNDLKAMLTAVGWAVMGVDGGATGPLFGMFFNGMGNGVTGEALDGKATAAMFAAGLASLQAQTKATVGDKTLMDAFIPAVDALSAAADGGATPADAMQAAAAAAVQGAESTKDIAARFGRAKNIGEGSKGYPDPGATSVSLIFKAFAEALGSA